MAVPSCGSSMAHAQEQQDEHSLQAKFAAAVKVMRSLPEEGPFQPSDDMMLMFYSYYKQATIGPCNIPQPSGFWDAHRKAKWDAWSSLGNMSTEEAMRNYVDDILLILETIPISDEVSDLVQKLGNFYTEVDGEETEEFGGHEVDRKSFSRPFAKHTDELNKALVKPAMEGFGDLWQDIQERDSHHSRAVASVEKQGVSDSCEMERGEQRRSEEEENGDDAEDGEEKAWTASSRMQTEEERWRSGTRGSRGGSSSNVEPSLTFTNGTHSSLNSEEEEEELACSVERGVRRNPYARLNGRRGDRDDAAPEKNHRSTDSDNEEFCDSMEHLAMEEVWKDRSPGSGAASENQNDWFESDAASRAVDPELSGDPYFKDGFDPRHHDTAPKRGRSPPSPELTCGARWCVSADAAAGCCVSRSGRPLGFSTAHVNEQIATALLRLQRDMAAVLHRLHALEMLTMAQIPRPSWWPFDLSPFTVAVTALWPLVAHWLFQLYLLRRRRKIP